METITETELEQSIESLSNEDKKALKTKIFLDLNEMANLNLRAKNKTSMVIKKCKLLGISMGKKDLVNQKIVDLPPVESLVYPDPEINLLKEQSELELVKENELVQERKLAA